MKRISSSRQLANNQFSRTIVLGMAVLVAAASSAFASSKASIEVREPFEVNGQQLAPGSYQLHWDGTGSNVEVSFTQGKKERAKTTAQLVPLDKAYTYDSAVVDHSGAKASVSEVRFAGKKYALKIGGGEKAEMGSGTESGK